MSWRHFIAENFCMFDSAKNKRSEFFSFKEDENGNLLKDKKGMFISESIGVKKNPTYIKGKRPKWCEKKYKFNHRKEMSPQDECVFDKCPFLAMASVEPIEYAVMMIAWEKAYKDGIFKDIEGFEQEDETPTKRPNKRSRN